MRRPRLSQPRYRRKSQASPTPSIPPLSKLPPPQGAAILHKDIPGLLENSSYPMFKSMSLKLVASLSGGRLDAETLAVTQIDLARLPPTAPPRALQQAAQMDPDFN